MGGLGQRLQLGVLSLESLGYLLEVFQLVIKQLFFVPQKSQLPQKISIFEGGLLNLKIPSLEGGVSLGIELINLMIKMLHMAIHFLNAFEIGVILFAFCQKMTILVPECLHLFLIQFFIRDFPVDNL